MMNDKIHNISSTIAALYESIRVLESNQIDSEIGQKLIVLSASRVEQLVSDWKQLKCDLSILLK